MEAYCENPQCLVVLYRVENVQRGELVDQTNCPGCGRFGRLKDDLKKKPNEPWDDEA